MIKKIILFIAAIIVVLVLGFLSNYLPVGMNQKEEVPVLQEVKLYFSTRDAMYLQEELREIKTDKLYENTIKALLEGPETSNLNPTIPEGVELIEFKLEKGIAYLDFNQALIDNHWGGSTGESLTIYSLVNTLCQFEEIIKVKILIEGEEVETLAGHMYLREPIEPNNKIIKK